MLDLNSSLFFITFLIVMLFFALGRIYFRPIDRIIGERDKRSEHENRTLGSLAREIESHTQTLDAKLSAAQKEAQKIKEELVDRGEAIRLRLVEQAREDSSRLFAEKMAELDRQLIASERELEKQVEQFSRKIQETWL